MNLKNTFTAMLIGENQELKKKKTDGSLYPYTTVAIMQDGAVANLRMMDDGFQEVQKLEHFKNYKFTAEYNTDYDRYMVVAITPVMTMPGGK